MSAKSWTPVAYNPADLLYDLLLSFALFPARTPSIGLTGGEAL
jgi:hypothetical protein